MRKIINSLLFMILMFSTANANSRKFSSELNIAVGIRALENSIQKYLDSNIIGAIELEAGLSHKIGQSPLNFDFKFAIGGAGSAYSNIGTQMFSFFEPKIGITFNLASDTSQTVLYLNSGLNYLMAKLKNNVSINPAERIDASGSKLGPYFGMGLKYRAASDIYLAGEFNYSNCQIYFNNVKANAGGLRLIARIIFLR